MPKDHVKIKSVGAKEKSLELRQLPNPDQVQLVITNEAGEREAVIVLWGDLNGAIAAMRHDPAQG